MSIELSDNIMKDILLYPDVEDNKFNIKIAEKDEFHRTKKKDITFDNIEEYSNDINCEFTELLPHQIFVKNFLSFQTPYNSLLLYHGLGTGKTCSAMGVSETMRIYLKNLGINKKILIVATPNIQDNFRKQLFNENKLKNINGQWILNSCVGNNLLNEIRANKYSSKKNIVSQINKLIDNGYEFMGYTKLSHLIEEKTSEKKINSYFDNRLIIIDEVHNIRVNDDIENKKIANNLFNLVKKVKNIQLLLLSATPMFNSYKEIIWIINLMNLNDNRPSIEESDIFDKDGNFLTNETGEEIGKKKFVQKVTGYVSFVRGENPFTFPYRIFPYQFDKSNSFLNSDNIYPRTQFNNQNIIQSLEHVDVFNIGIGEYQKKVYLKIINNLLNSSKKNENVDENTNEKLGYNKMQIPLEALNVVYPNDSLDGNTDNENINEFVGKDGLAKMVSNADKFPYVFNDDYLDDNKRSIFCIDNIKNYSNKIHSILNSIIKNDGITLVYSQYLYGGLIPLAIALEEIGFNRFTKKHTLLSDEYKSKHKIRSDKYLNNKKYSYAMITGSTSIISSQNANEIKNAVSDDNIHGDVIKVVLISRAGSEGIDFKNIRSVHIMEPWYNMNRIEQIIGRGVRNCSHRLLPYNKRNVSIYLYGTTFENDDNLIEGIDLYLYRISELKAIKIGQVSRLLKETSVDCLLSSETNNLPIYKLNTETEQIFSNQMKVNIQVGDKPYSAICDYMESCNYKCSIYDKNIDEIISGDINELEINFDTTSEFNNLNNVYQLLFNIKRLFNEKHSYYYDEIKNRLTHFNNYSDDELMTALNILINDSNEEIVDIYGRSGTMINHGNIYFFQPKEITSENISLIERSTPLDSKYYSLDLINNESDYEEEDVTEDENINILEEYYKLIDIYKQSRTYKIVTDIINNSTIDFKDNLIDFMENIFVYHITFDNLDYNKRYQILLLLNNEKILNDNKNDIIKKYIFKYSFTYDDDTYLLFPKNNDILLLENLNNKWVEANNFYKKEARSTIIEKFIVQKNNASDYLGIGIYNSKNNYDYIFKIKETYKDRARGSVCSIMYKNDLLQNIENIFNIDITKFKVLRDNQTIHICLLIEILYRYFEFNNTNDKTWFITPTQANIFKDFNSPIKL